MLVVALSIVQRIYPQANVAVARAQRGFLARFLAIAHARFFPSGFHPDSAEELTPPPL
jgi:hypothetical protein